MEDRIGFAGKTDRIQGQLHSAGNFQFLKHAEEIVLNGVCAEFEFFRDLGVRETLRNKTSNLFLSVSQRSGASLLSHPQRSDAGKCLQHALEFVARRPDLSSMDTMKTLAERFDGAGRAEKPLSSRPECVDHLFGITRLNQEYGLGVWKARMDFPKCLESRKRSFLHGSTDQDRVRSEISNGLDQFLRVHGPSYNRKTKTRVFQGLTKKLASHRRGL